MKRSISKKLTVTVALLMSMVLALLFVGSYHVVRRIVRNEIEHYEAAMVGIYGDLIKYEAQEQGCPIDRDFADTIGYFGNYFCQWYRVDYIYTYSLGAEEGKVLLLDFSSKPGVELRNVPAEELMGTEIPYTFSEAELMLRAGGADHTSRDNDTYEQAQETIYAITDQTGERIFVAVGISKTQINEIARGEFTVVALVLFGVFLLLTLTMYFLIRRWVFRPAKKISESMTAFITDGKRAGKKLPEKGSDEFAMIARAFNSMSDDMDAYLADIRRLNSAEERQKAELDIAARIQQGLLSPDLYRTDHYELHAMMTPAKNVGGDLYDYLPLPDGKLLLTIADVSGKGISASMYMAVALVLIRQYAEMGCSPGEILRRLNRAIAANNPNLLFITAFVGIYDPSDGRLLYANAGHNPPYLLRAVPERLEGARNTILGIYAEESYTQAETHLNPGDILFLYTDGVNEAIDRERNFYGEKRLEEALRGFRATHIENPVGYICGKVREFVKDADQSDDMTMLALIVKQTRSLLLDADTREFEKIKQVILESSLPGSLRRSLCIAAEEIFVNICSYGYPDGVPAGEKITFTFARSDRIVLHFEDGGVPYDPTKEVITEDDYDLDGAPGGLGKLIAFTIADKVEYEYSEGKNKLTIRKYIMEESYDDHQNS